MNLPSTVIKQSFANYEIAKSIARFPVVTNDVLRYYTLPVHCALLYYTASKIFHGARWHSHFQTPMIIHNSKNLFVNDFVHIHYQDDVAVAKILKYFQKVINFI